MKRYSIVDVIVGILGVFALFGVALVILGYMVVFMVENKLTYGKWWI